MFFSLISLTNLNSTVNNLNWSTNSSDLPLLLLLVISLLIHLFILQRDKIFAWLLAVYSSYVVVLFFPFNLWLPKLTLEQMVWAKAGGFIVLAVFLAVIFIRAHIFNSFSPRILAKVVQGLVYGILSMGLIISLLATLLPLEIISHFSSFSQNIFNKDVARFVWIVCPLALMIFSVKFSSGHRGPGRPPLE